MPALWSISSIHSLKDSTRCQGPSSYLWRATRCANTFTSGLDTACSLVASSIQAPSKVPNWQGKMWLAYLWGCGFKYRFCSSHRDQSMSSDATLLLFCAIQFLSCAIWELPSLEACCILSFPFTNTPVTLIGFTLNNYSVVLSRL